MLRIAMVSVHSCPLAPLGGKETGGMNVYIRELSRELAKRGLQVDIFTRSQDPAIPTVVDYHPGVRVIHLKAGCVSPSDKNHLWFYLPEFLHNSKKFIREEKGRYDLIHSHYWLSGWVGSALRSLYGIPLVHMFHTLGYLKDEVTRPLGTAESSIRLKAESELLKRVDHLVASSAVEKEQLLMSAHIPAGNISVIPCGVDTRLFRPLPARQSKRRLALPDKRYILFVGRIDPIKGIDVLLKAMSIIKAEGKTADDLCLLVIGGDAKHPAAPPDSELQRLKQMTTDLSLEDVVSFLGPQDQERLPYFYAAAEICVLPSRYESFGMVALEAMACGRPVIASQVGGLPAFIQDSLTGFLVPRGNETVVAEKIRTLLNHASLRRRMGKEGRVKAEEFGWEKIARQMISLYGTCAEKRKGGSPSRRITHQITSKRLSQGVAL